MADKPNIRYGNYEDHASRFVPGEAWVLASDGTWNRADSYIHSESAVELSKADWEKVFPNTPPLPPEAFKR